MFREELLGFWKKIAINNDLWLPYKSAMNQYRIHKHRKLYFISFALYIETITF